MKNQSGTIKTNLELYRVVKGGSGGYRRLPGGSAHFSLQTNRQTLHHNIYIITITIIVIITNLIMLILMPDGEAALCEGELWTTKPRDVLHPRVELPL